MHYLVGGTGIPNYGDELIAQNWLKFLSKEKPESRVFLDCAIPSISTMMLQPANWRASHVSFVKDVAARGKDANFWTAFARGYRFLDRGGFATNQRLAYVNDLFSNISTFHLIGGGYISDKWPHTGFLLGFAGALKRKFGTRLFATGLGLTPIADPDADVKRIFYRVVKGFDTFEVRDKKSFDFVVRNTGLKNNVKFGLDDCFLTPVSHVETAKPRLHISCFMERERSDIFAQELAAMRQEIDTKFSSIDFWRCAPHRDQVALEAISAQFPELRVRDVPELINGQACNANDVMISNRFHPHMMAARAGCSGYFYQIAGDYYAAKHESVTSLGSAFRPFTEFSQYGFAGSRSMNMANKDSERVAAKQETARSFYSN